MTFRELGHFCGTELSDFDKKGHVSYETLAETMGSLVLCNEIANHYDDLELELVNGDDYNEEYDEYYAIYQYYIIDEHGYDILKKYTPDEIVYYSNVLGIYVWGVGHWGTSWSIVPTEISIDEEF